MENAAAMAAYIVEEVVMLFDDARADGQSAIRSSVGAKFEARARFALAALQSAGIESEVPPALSPTTEVGVMRDSTIGVTCVAILAICVMTCVCVMVLA